MPITEPAAVRTETALASTTTGARERSNPAEITPTPAPAERSRLWVWFVVAFVVQFAVWVGLFVLAAHHPVAEVPLASPAAR